MGPTYARVFPTGENRMARRIILNHPFISGKNLPATEALLAKSWVNELDAVLDVRQFFAERSEARQTAFCSLHEVV